MRRVFDTGDNPQIRGDALRHAAAHLTKHGWRDVNAVDDQTGEVFSIHFHRPLPGHLHMDIKIALVAKASSVWRGIVSTQLKHLQKLAEDKTPLVMWIQDEDKFYWFNALDVLMRGEGINTRFGVQMWNFPLRLGIRWQPNQPIINMIQKMVSRQTDAERLKNTRL